jgi:hypothetical protein
MWPVMTTLVAVAADSSWRAAQGTLEGSDLGDADHAVAGGLNRASDQQSVLVAGEGGLGFLLR